MVFKAFLCCYGLMVNVLTSNLITKRLLMLY